MSLLVDLCPQSSCSGVVPYLGTYLTVLTMLDTALPDTVEVGSHPTVCVCSYLVVLLHLGHESPYVTLVVSVPFSKGGLINFEKRRRVGVAT